MKTAKKENKEQVIRLTEETIDKFRPLFTEEFLERIKYEQEMVVLGAVKDKTACGVLAFLANDIISIEYIAVSDEYRRQGVADAMLTFLCRYAYQYILPVTCIFTAADKEAPVYRFFANRGDFELEELDGEAFCISYEQVKEAQALGNDTEVTEMTTFFDYPHYIQQKFLSDRINEGRYFLDAPEIYGRLSRSLCLTAGTAKDIQAAVFVTELDHGHAWELTYVWCEAGKSMMLMRLLAQLRVRFLTEMPQDAVFLLEAVESSTYAIAQKVFPACGSRKHYYEATWTIDSPSREEAEEE